MIKRFIVQENRGCLPSEIRLCKFVNKFKLTFLTTGRTQGLLSLSRYAPTPKLTLYLNESTLYAADNLRMLGKHQCIG